VVMLVCPGVYAWLQRQHNPVSAHNSPPAKTHTAPAKTAPTQPAAAPATQQPPSAASSTPAPQPSSPAANTPAAQAPVTKAEVGTPPPPQSAPNPAATVRIEIIASEPVWVLARTDGKFAFTGTMDTNTRRSVDGEKDTVRRLGNAGGEKTLLNAHPIPPVGPKGQPRTVQFTSGGFQIVPAKPPSESPAPIARL